MDFPKILKTLREHSGLSQNALAKIIDVSQASIGYWEKGQRTPSISAVEKLAQYFGVSAGYLLGLDTSPISESKQLSGFLNYLESLGYEFIDGVYYDAPYNEIGMIHVKDENLDIPLTREDFDRLEDSVKDNIILEIYRLRKEKNI